MSDNQNPFVDGNRIYISNAEVFFVPGMESRLIHVGKPIRLQ